MTNRRLFLIGSTSSSFALRLPLACIQRSHVHKPVLGSAKLQLTCYLGADSRPAEHGIDGSFSSVDVVLSGLKGGDLDRLSAEVKRLQLQQDWLAEDTARASPTPQLQPQQPVLDAIRGITVSNPLASGSSGSLQALVPGSRQDSAPQGMHPSTSSPALGGLAALRQQVEARRDQEDRALDRGFQDLRNLMDVAGQLTELANRLRSNFDRIRGQQQQQPGDSGTSAALEGEGEVYALLEDLGITSPVTIEVAGAKAFHKEMAKEVADFLLTPPPGRPSLIDQHQGMLLLTDLYCLFNRARGTALVSPDDLLRACELLAGLQVEGLRLRSFESGVKAVQSKAHSEEASGKACGGADYRLLTLHLVSHRPFSAGSARWCRSTAGANLARESAHR